MTTLLPLLASALRRVEPYLDLVPPSAAAQVREALAAYDAHVAKQAIVQVPGGPQCSHAYAVENGRCVGCGAEVG